MDVHQPGRIGDRRVAAIEDADLHQFEGRDVLDELHADLFERRAAGGKLSSSTHCLNGSQKTGQLSSTPKSSLEDIALAVGGGRRDAVDHAVRERRRCPAPRSAKAGSESCASPTTASAVTWPLWGMLSQDMTVKGGVPSALRRLQPGQDQAEDGLRVVGIGGVGDDVGMRRVELAESRGR